MLHFFSACTLGPKDILRGARIKWTLSHRGFCVLVTAALIGLFAGSTSAQAPTNAPGGVPPSSPIALTLGVVDPSAGDLNLTVPLGSYPQRGNQTFSASLVYDSRIWQVAHAGSSYAWQPTSVPGGTGGWRLLTNPSIGGTVTYTTTNIQCAVNTGCGGGGRNGCILTDDGCVDNPHGNYTVYTNFQWTDPYGNVHYFPTRTEYDPTGCDFDTPNYDAFASDSSGYHIYITNYTQVSIYSPNGSQIFPGSEDANGNQFTFDANGNFIDTLGRKPLVITTNCNGNSNKTCYDLLNSQGGTSRYMVTTESITAQTSFALSGVTNFSGTFKVIQSVQLPDGTLYQFTYDTYGELNGATLPTGGQVSYGYANFTDPYGNPNRWMNSHSGSGGTWTFTPHVLSTCTSTQVNCQLTMTAILATGDARIYTFTLNNGAFPVQVQYYNQGISAANLHATVMDAYDFTNACPLPGCHGAGYIREIAETATLPVPNGSITRQTQYSYDGPATGNTTAIKEWNFLQGTSPTFASIPDRSTYFVYFATATNNINQPAAITICNNSGTDQDCNGAGSKVSQTKITYDSYGTNGLIPVSNAVSHDDLNFGVGNTSRGNPTQVQRWVSGSTYLTTQNTYDITGHIINVIDPKNNVVTYDYADNFFQDNGTSPPQGFSPTQSTNSFLTKITYPVIGSQKFGYYFGSGKEAFSTDPNGTSTYSHYMDSLDRLTGTSLPIGWSLNSYTSPTQFDGYSAVADTTASVGCTSCIHSQSILDNLGRVISKRQMNNPLGVINIDTTYDVNGRIHSMSHPYVNTSDPTYVFETWKYDDSNRIIQATHPDGQFITTAYGVNVVAAGGIATQQGPASPYGVGYPMLLTDEVGKQRQEWIDGFGRIIEVDEPVATPATPATGSATVSGSEQNITGGGTAGHGTITISGSEQSATGDPPCILYDCGGNCIRWGSPPTYYDQGIVSITVFGHTDSVGYGQGSTSSGIASALASVINGDSAAYVSAAVSGSVITLTAKITGQSTNYSLSATSWTTDNTGNFFSASFSASPSGSALTGGTNGSGSTVYDTGSVWINVNGFQVSVPYGQGSTANSIASALSSALNSTGSPVIASANGSVVTVTASQAGYNTNSYTLSSGSTSNQPNSFSPPSFSSARSGSTLAGGADAAGPSLATPAVTLYLYDAMNNLTKVVQGSQTRTFVLDGLSRRTSVTTPEAGTDTFTYTTSGGALCAADASALCQSQDARGVVTIYSYDALNRLIGKSFSVPQNSGVAAMPNVCTPIGSTTSQNVCFNYDQGGSSAFALGRETQMVDPSGSETYTYNQMGWVTAMQKTIGSQTFLTSYQYNAGGAVTKITYPSGHAVQYSLDAIGQISGVSRDGTNYATGIVYNASGQFTTFNYGNGVAANFSYSPTRSQLTGLSYSHGNQTYLNLNYLYSQDLTNCPGGPAGNNGQISCVIDIGQPGRTVNYTYDAVRRLSTAFTNGDSANFLKWGLSWTYDQYGNRLSQNQTAGSPPYNNLSFGNTNGLTGAFTNRPDGFPFDASGNMLSDGHNTLTYDAENRVVSSVNQISGATGVYSYDGNGKRVQKLTGAIPTVYIFSGHGIAEYDNGAGPASPSREYIFAGGSLIATVNGSTTTFHHADHLSVRLNTDGTPGSPTNGQVVGEQGTYPFGESWYASNTTTKLFFTTYERDSESQNDFAMARYYISRLGRFSCVDPKMGTPSDPQSWNRYAYVRNDPIDLTDPSGMSWWLKLLEFLIKWLLNFLTGGGGFFLHFPGPQINIPFSTPPTFSSGPGLDWQTVVFGPPDPSKMIINNWSPDAHDILVQLALGPCGVSPLDISLIQAGSRDVDKRHALDPKYANAHYMAMRGQSADAAIAGANAWTSWYEQDAQDAWNDKDYDDAMFTLGQSIHPVMDSTSPMHVNLKTGKPKTWPTAGNAPFHSPFEGLGFEDITMIPPVRQSYPKAFEAMNQAIRDAYEFVTGRHLICGGAK